MIKKNVVTLEVNNKAYGGWLSIEVTRSMESLSGSFSLGLTVKPSKNNPFPQGIKHGDACVVRIDEDIVVTGYVDKLHVSIDAESHEYNVSGRDKAGDLVDCSAINSPGSWKNQKLEAIATEIIHPFGIKIKAETDTGELFKDFALEQGETAFEAIERMCKLRGLLCISDRKGNLILTRAKTTKSASDLVEGINVLEASCEYDSKDQFNQITVKGQSQGNDHHNGKVVSQANATVKDSGIKRYRPRLILAEGQADNAKCKQRAEWERSVQEAKALKVSVKVQGWRQKNGALWEVNTVARVKIPSIFVEGENLLISEVQYNLDENGTTTQLTLCNPDAFKVMPEAEKKKKEKRKRRKEREKERHTSGQGTNTGNQQNNKTT